MRPVSVLLAAALLTVSGAAAPVRATDCASGDTTCQQLEQAKRSQTNANQKLQDIQRSVADAQQKAKWTRAYIDELSVQIRRQQAAIADTQAKLSDLERQIRFTEAEITRREAHLEVRQGLLGQRVRSLDKHGSFDYLELVVTSRTFTQLVDRVVIMQEIVRSDQRLVNALRVERDRVRDLSQQLDRQRAEQASLLEQQRDEEARLLQARAAQQAALAYYEQLEAQYQVQRQQVEAEKAQIDELVTQLQAQYDGAARGLGGGSGRFAWPERGPVTQGFGCTDLLGEPYDPNCPTRHIHTGIDIGCGFGTPIGAADAGIVSYVNYGWGGGYGNFVLMTHGNGFATLYAHLSAIAVTTGQPVRRGQVIGAEGSTGFSTGPHLHFEIRFYGAYQNPLSYLA
ncbi:MAG TPA: peptidoglycan DD-metalloendopeptidase family protein [Candidatus Dormibacteraeota bacterium]|jgi:murein DD-endopeptidase MepM/ murein hydrolase activator NlpD